MRSPGTARPRAYYACHPYRSHERVARDYRQIIGEACDLISEQDAAGDAEIVFLHIEPHDYAALYRMHPRLAGKYVISCCVWEADDLPDSYKRSLSHVQEVWTCSRYCESVFARYHPRVIYMPYVVDRDTACGGRELDEVKAAIGYHPDRCYFLTIARLSDRRKNTDTLIETFQRYCGAMPEARLIVKTSPDNHPPHPPHPRVTYLLEDFSEAHLNGLYGIADAYVSAHHAEGWGLTMSDAMLFGKPVIATGYSGNLEFMNDANSFLLKCAVEPIRPRDRYHLFGADMRWAYVDEEHLGEVMVSVFHNRKSPDVLARVERASADIRAFDRQSVGQRIRARLDLIAAGQGNG